MPRNYETQVREGQEAQRILESPVFRAAIEEARQDFFRQWLESDDLAKREELHASARNLDATEAALRRIISRGQYAAEALRRAEADLPDNFG